MGVLKKIFITAKFSEQAQRFSDLRAFLKAGRVNLFRLFQQPHIFQKEWLANTNTPDFDLL